MVKGFKPLDNDNQGIIVVGNPHVGLGTELARLLNQKHEARLFSHLKSEVEKQWTFSQLPYEESYNFDCKLNMGSFKKSLEMCKKAFYNNKKVIFNSNVMYRYSKGLYVSCNNKKLN